MFVLVQIKWLNPSVQNHIKAQLSTSLEAVSYGWDPGSDAMRQNGSVLDSSSDCWPSNGTFPISRSCYIIIYIYIYILLSSKQEVNPEYPEYPSSLPCASAPQCLARQVVVFEVQFLRLRSALTAGDRSPTRCCPSSYVGWFATPINSLDISPIKHSYWSPRLSSIQLGDTDLPNGWGMYKPSRIYYVYTTMI